MAVSISLLVYVHISLACLRFKCNINLINFLLFEPLHVFRLIKIFYVKIMTAMKILLTNSEGCFRVPGNRGTCNVYPGSKGTRSKLNKEQRSFEMSRYQGKVFLGAFF